MKLTEKQREALQELADVMDKYSIVFNSCENHGEEYDLTISGEEVDYAYMKLDSQGIEQLLQGLEL